MASNDVHKIVHYKAYEKERCERFRINKTQRTTNEERDILERFWIDYVTNNFVIIDGDLKFAEKLKKHISGDNIYKIFIPGPSVDFTAIEHYKSIFMMVIVLGYA